MGSFHCKGWLHTAVFMGLVLVLPELVQAQGRFDGFYAGVEGGAISYNTQITFDGVDDPAGRGGGGIGIFLGYNRVFGSWLIGAESFTNFATIPDPYTFNPMATGFSELDLRRGASYGLDMRMGYQFVDKILIFASIGFSANRQSVRIDGVPLDQFSGGASPIHFVAWQPSLGIEFSLHPRWGLRFLFRFFSGRDLELEDFGSVFSDVSLARFDVEPEQQQFLTGLIFHF